MSPSLGGWPTVSVWLGPRGPEDMALSVAESEKVLGDLGQVDHSSTIKFSDWIEVRANSRLLTSCDLRGVHWATLTLLLLLNYIHWMRVCEFLLSLKYSPQRKKKRKIMFINYDNYNDHVSPSVLNPYPIPATITYPTLGVQSYPRLWA